MSYNNGYNNVKKPNGINMTEIPGTKANTYISSTRNKRISKEGSPIRSTMGTKHSEVLGPDIVQFNESKVK